MVLALAYSFSRNATYGGACYDGKKDSAVPADRRADREGLVAALGLGRALPFGCPDRRRPGGELISDRLYLKRGKSLITMPFVEWLRSQSRAGLSAALGAGRPEGAVVHVRRGDVTPCGRWRDRYLPSSYYVDVVKKHVPPNVPGAVYSEASSFEPWSELEGLNYTLRLDTSLVDAWRAVAAARYVVLSLSSFAYLPALLNENGTVLYSPTWHFAPLPHWVPVSEPIRARARSRAKRLAAERCPKTNNASAAAGAVGAGGQKA
jgi:hypothetical protein